VESRAISHLCQLRDDDLFREVSTGLGHILEVVNRLDRSARRLPGYRRFYTRSLHSHAVHMLGSLAEEEAAKFLILLDFVRCLPSLQNARSRQLKYFYDHLAKGIYAEYCAWRPVDFADVTRHGNLSRQAFYLDGPLGVDWIFNNDILRKRVDRLYVNYVRDDDGNRYWQYPRTTDFEIGYHTGAVIEIARALDAVGVASPEGLAVVAEVWRTVDITPDLTIGELKKLNYHTLKAIEERGLLKDASNGAYTHVHERWLFPLYPLDLFLNPRDSREQEEEIEELRKIQDQWTPDW